MQTTKCPSCNSDIVIGDDAYEGDLINCANCEMELEIISLHPAQLSVINSEPDLEEEEYGREEEK